MATHFLHIPIATPFSMQRIQNILSWLARDPLAAALPPVAWLPARELHCALMPFDLKTEGSVRDATQLLGSPEVRTILKECRNITAMSLSPGLSPSVVTLHGLKTANINLDDLDKTPLLQMCLKDCTLNFSRLHNELLHIFRRHIYTFGDPRTPMGEENPRIRVMSSKYMRTDVLKTTPPSWQRGSQPSKYRKPLYDARDLYMKYKNHTWTRNLEIETLSISETGIRDIIRRGSCIGQGYREIARIPLPGVTEGMLEPQNPYDRYIRAKKRHEEKMPVKPLWLSLRPQHEAPDLTPKSVLSGATTYHTKWASIC